MKKIRKVKRKLADRIVMKMDLPGDQIEQTDDKDVFRLAQIENLESLYKSGVLIGDTSVTGVDSMVVAKNEKEKKKRELLEDQNLKLAIEGRRTVQYAAKGDLVDKEAHWGDLALNNKYVDDDIYLPSSASSSDSEEADSEVSSNSDSSVYSDTDESVVDMDCAPQSKNVSNKASEEESEAEEYKADADSGSEVVPKSKDGKKKSLLSTNLLVDLNDADEATKKMDALKDWCSSTDIKNLLRATDDDDIEMSDGSDVLEDVLSDIEQEPVPKKMKKEKVNDEHEDNDNLPKAAIENNMENVVSKATKTLKKLKRPLTPEERALAVKLISSAKSERDLLQWGYHRFRFFEDDAQMPDWFVDDERKHMRKALPIETKSLVTRPVQGKTIGKAEEAKARKKKRLVKKLKKVRQKAEQLDDDLPEKEKWDKIKTMYNKAGLLKKKRKPVHLVVNSKGGARNRTAPKGSKVKIVDRRMKSDMRSKKGGRPDTKKHGKRGRVPVGKNKAKQMANGGVKPNKNNKKR